jgi:hypothetical protein
MWRRQRELHQIVRNPLPVVGAIPAWRIHQFTHEYSPGDHEFTCQCGNRSDEAISN